MDVNSLISMIECDENKYHQDVVFIKNRLIILLDKEVYKSVSVTHRWLEELLLIHHNIKV
jgi:hypothetical protein